MKREYNSYKINSEKANILNKHLVFRILYENTSISRTDITRFTNFQPSTITNIISNFYNLKLIKTVGKGVSKKVGGRIPVLIKLNEDYKFIISIEIDINKIKFLVTDIYYQIKERIEIEYKSENKDEFVTIIINKLKEILAKYENKIWGICLGCSGIIDYNSGVIKHSTQLALHNYPVVETIVKSLAIKDIPLFVENDVRLAAFAENRIGLSKNYQNSVYLRFGIIYQEKYSLKSMGSGIILDHKLYHGENYNAGEIYDNYSVELNEKLNSVKEKKEVSDLFNSMGEKMGLVFSTIVNVIDPGIIIVGSDNVAMNEFVIQPFINGLINSSKKYIIGENKLEIVESKLEPDAVCLGGISLVIDNILENDDFFRKLTQIDEE